MSTRPTPPAFDLEGPLPTGTTVLEASAGTGKTYTVARLVSRYVTEEPPVPVDRLLVVSFSEASSRELRDRVRERLVLDRDAATGPTAERLDRALADFDGATVTTTHGFCNAMLRELGTAVDHDRDAELLPDVSDVVREVSDDLYVRKWGRAGAEAPTTTVAGFRALARLVATDPGTPLVPVLDDAPDPAVRQRLRIAAAVREEVARRLRRARLLTYDDMVLRLDAALADPATADLAAARLRARFDVVLVDEFQDTDPVQWRILRTAFHGHATLVLVGDPKQAVYGFRGADVRAYLDARADATTTATLPRNHRSDAGVLTGLLALLGGAALGHEEIRVRPVEPARGGARLHGAGAPVQLRVLTREGHDENRYGIPVPQARATIRADLAGRVVDLLTGGARLETPDGTRAVHPGDIAVVVRTNNEAEAVREVLAEAGVPAVVQGRTSVFATDAALAWQHLLEALEQPHRTSRVRRLAIGPLVGRTAETLEDGLDDLALRLRLWLRVLQQRGVAALFERVQVDLRLHERLLAQPGGERLLTDLRHVGEVLHEESLRGDLGLTALASWLCRRRSERGEQSVERSRRLETDAAAVQVLTSHMSKGLEFPVVLAPSLWDHKPWASEHPRFHDAGGRRVRDVGGPASPEHGEHVNAELRESADEELRLAYVTLTRAAALVVAWWAPTYNSPSGPLTRLLLHEAPADDDGPPVPPTAVTPPPDAQVLDRLRALAAGSAGTVDVAVVPPPGATAAVRWRAPARPAPTLALAGLDRPVDTTWRRTSYSALTHAAHEATYGAGAGAVTGTPGAGASGGAGAWGAAFASEAEPTRTDDEPDDTDGPDGPDGLDGLGGLGGLDGIGGADGLGGIGGGAGGPTGAADPDAHLLDVPSAWHDIPGGTGVGTLVHLVLEHHAPAGGPAGDDPRGSSPDRSRAPSQGPSQGPSLRALVARLSRGQGLDVDLLTDALQTAVDTPLGPLADDLPWSAVPARDRLAELEVELPLAGGDRSRGGGRGGEDAVALHRLVDLWRTHVTDGPLAGYADALATLPALDPTDPASRLRGYLTGSIDAVVRVGAPGQERYLVVDHKTNRLAPREEPLTAWHYRTEALARSMIEAHYPLQALVYAVALHRYLRWRLPRYEPDRHLGGVLYLYLRGMSGPGVLDSTGAPPGVLQWRPPTALVTGFSDLLTGGGGA